MCRQPSPNLDPQRDTRIAFSPPPAFSIPSLPPSVLNRRHTHVPHVGLTGTTSFDRRTEGIGAALTAQGLALVQIATDAEDDYIFRASDADANSAGMLDACNFVTYDDDFNVIWDTAKFVSGVSSTNHSIGRFRLKMKSYGDLAMFPVNTSDASENCYWSSNTVIDDQPSNCTSLSLSADGRLYLHQQLRAHRLSFPDQSTELCDIKGTCGINSYCRVQNELPVCKCLPGFEFIHPELEWSGCKRNFTSETCSSEDEGFTYNMSQLENVQWLDDPYEGPSHMESMENCIDVCLKDCNCCAALYTNSTCSKQKCPLKYGRRLLDQSASVFTFVKVGVSKFNGMRSVESHKDCCTIMFDASAATNGALFLLVFVLCFFIYRHRARGNRTMSRNRELDLVEEIAPRSFSFDELRIASDDFRQVIGKGAFGTVFKGVLRHNQREIAIKRLEKVMGEGEPGVEFQAEMRAMGRTHHRNLVCLLDFCHEGSRRLLVYEFISKGSLADLIFHAAKWSELWGGGAGGGVLQEEHGGGGEGGGDLIVGVGGAVIHSCRNIKRIVSIQWKLRLCLQIFLVHADLIVEIDRQLSIFLTFLLKLIQVQAWPNRS
ncbi:G-type lectin S-receptor-like serine/threonine-protein kinase LECRK3 [Curcuma longa]|uniref:G-type lectin S-receptor-like serine/threonine-protein kinase LECRK3 n=1 Tax=Curcuma longa TaxID=136217 RepID=UPI003D9E6BBA